MYEKYFGLREQPFGVTPDPRFLYLSAAHREALASLYYGIEANRGFLGLIAKPGMGKTTILFHLLEKFRSSARTAFLFQTQCTSREFLRFLLYELGYESDGNDFVRMHEEFNRRLLQEARAGNARVVQQGPHVALRLALRGQFRGRARHRRPGFCQQGAGQ